MADKAHHETSGAESRRTVESDTPESGFEVFQAQKQARRLPPDVVSLTRTNILLSEELAEQLAEAKRVVLLYNRQGHEIGIRPAAPDEDGYKISNRSIASRSFYLHFRIEERGHFKARVDAFGKLIVSLRKDAGDEPADKG